MCKNAIVCRNFVFDPKVVEKGKDRPYPDCVHHICCKSTQFFEDLREYLDKESAENEMQIRRFALTKFTEYYSILGF